MNFKQFYKKADSIQRVGIYPGCFCPPHIGHYQAAKRASENNDKVYIIISPTGREEITSKQSLAIWKEYAKTIPNLKFSIANITPVRSAYELIEQLNNSPESKNIVVNLYADRDDKDRWNNVKQFSEQLRRVNKIQTDRIASASTIRRLLRKNSRGILKYFPKNCDRAKIFSILTH